MGDHEILSYFSGIYSLFGVLFTGLMRWCTKIDKYEDEVWVETEILMTLPSLIFWFLFYQWFNPGAQTNMWTTPFVKNLKNTEYYLLKNSMKYQKMKLLMQGHWPTCEPHHLSTGTRQHWLASHNYSPRWWVLLSFIFCIIIIDLVPLSFIFCRIYFVHLP